jgi:hypothetical protein
MALPKELAELRELRSLTVLNKPIQRFPTGCAPCQNLSLGCAASANYGWPATALAGPKQGEFGIGFGEELFQYGAEMKCWSSSNENWEFDEHGFMRRRIASINDLPIAEADRKYHWPLGRRPDDHPGLSELGL